VRRFAAQFQGARDEVLRGILHDQSPGLVSPVKLILAIRGLVARALPISAPGPLTMLMTPGGTMSWSSSANLRMDQGVGDAGLRITQLPAASAGASFHAAISSGKLKGMICP